MSSPRPVLCGDVIPGAGGKSSTPIRLRIGRGPRDVHFHVAHLSRALKSNVDRVAVDLIELAAYLYATDQVVTRGGLQSFEYGARWRRDFRFEVPVRCPERWKRAEVVAALTEAVGFLTDDRYEFRFHPHPNPNTTDGYLFSDPPAADPKNYQEVVLFSGGLDSLAGAVREILGERRRVVLVSHRPAPKIHRRQDDLVDALRTAAAGRAFRPLHIGLEVNKGRALGREFTQRSRSFLFTAVGAAVALAFGLRRVRFYENGVTSMNLPLSPQVVGGRASRTTHPKALAAFERLLTLLFGSFEVDNPFRWQTKGQLLRELHAGGHAHLCRLAVSCAHTWEQRRDRPHCGRCSQCVDRRLTSLAAGLSDAQDPAAGYVEDVLIGRCEGADLTLVERYVGMARQVNAMGSPVEFAIAFPEVLRVIRHTGMAADEAVRAAFEMHKAHAGDVLAGLAEGYRAHAGDLARTGCPANTMLGVSLGARPTTVPPPADDEPDGEIRADRDFFRVTDGAKWCVLGNSIEFRVAEYLIARINRFVSYDDLRENVWEEEDTLKNTIQKAVSNLRRLLLDDGLTGFVINGSERGHYRLTPTDAAVHE